MKKINPNKFTYELWRNGSIIDFGFPCREYNIIKNRETLKRYAIGYCCATRTVCRQKQHHKAIMYCYNNNIFWSHLTNVEFSSIFTKES